MMPQCCSAISPCSHQRNNPRSVCATCVRAAEYGTSLHPLQAITDAPSIVPDASAHRAAVEAGYASLRDYVAIETGGCAPPVLTTPAHRTVIGFTGLVGAGKSQAARYLVNTHGFRRGKFAAALKEMLRTLLRYRGVDAAAIERMIEGDLKEVPSPHLNGCTPRHAMQTLGTEWGRDCIHRDLWVDIEMDAHLGTPALVFEDARFANEVAAIRAAGGVLVRIERTGAGSAVGAGHSSEGQSLGETIVIRNDGTLAEFHERLDHLLTSQVKAGELRSAVG